ncbi:MAG: glycosyltransferase family 39 protein [Cellvibrionales bacterium]|nr:glycosyltransferase family 39 protein [Cellvibrionales bacterium]
MQASLTKHSWPWLLAVTVLLLTLYRALILFSLPELSLHFDEAQYWLWSQDLQWGYYSKPPMLAFVIHCFTSLFGDAAPWVRSPALVFYPLTTWVIYCLAKKLSGDSKVASIAGLVFITMPGVSLSSMLITTDVVLFLWWSLSCLFFYQALQTNRWHAWLLLGVFAGCGLLTKYTMGIFAVTAALYLLLMPNLRYHWMNPKLWVAAGLSVLIFLPNILWNAFEGWPSLRHTVELSGSGVEGLHPTMVLTFWGEQFGVFGLISFALFVWFIISNLPWRLDKSQPIDAAKLFLWLFSVTFLLVISLQALQGRVYANWAAPTYAMASIAVAWCFSRWHKTLIIALALNLVLMFAVYHFDAIVDMVKPNAKKGPDPMKTLRGWDSFGNAVKGVMKDCPDCTLLTDRRETAAQLMYLLRDEKPVLAFWNPDHSHNNHYEMVYSLKAPSDQTYLFIVEGQLSDTQRQAFKAVTQVGDVTRYGRYRSIRHYTIYQATDFLGYRNRPNNVLGEQ